MSEAPETTFDPGQYLSDIRGQMYLEVKWRLVWLRTDAPESHVETEAFYIGNDKAIFRATVTKIKDGVVVGKATGYGSETPEGFADYIEKAETKAIGRALGALGYGTQFTDDFADAAVGMLADAPVGRNGGGGGAPAPIPFRTGGSRMAANHHPGSSGSGRQGGGAGGQRIANPGAAPTASQQGLLQKLAGEQDLDEPTLNQISLEVTNMSLGELNKGAISTLIDHLMARGRAGKG